MQHKLRKDNVVITYRLRNLHYLKVNFYIVFTLGKLGKKQRRI